MFIEISKPKYEKLKKYLEDKNISSNINSAKINSYGAYHIELPDNLSKIIFDEIKELVVDPITFNPEGIDRVRGGPELTPAWAAETYETMKYKETYSQSENNIEDYEEDYDEDYEEDPEQGHTYIESPLSKYSH